jgi:hypothetical protein
MKINKNQKLKNHCQEKSKGAMARMIFAIFSLIPLLFTNLAFAQELPLNSAEAISINAAGTVAGYDAVIRGMRAEPGKQVFFSVVDPEGKIFNLTGFADKSGVALTRLPGLHTSKAGEYKVYAGFSSQEMTAFNKFNVFSGRVSAQESEIFTESQMISASDLNQHKFTVRLYDKYKNPISNHQLQIQSKRPNDKVEFLDSEFTDESGELDFRVISNELGYAEFSAFDVLEKVELEEKLRFVIHDGGQLPKNVGGPLVASLIPSAHAQSISGGNAASLQFVGINSNVAVGESLNFSLRALDSAGMVSENYLGKVNFSVTEGSSSAVDLPAEYQFVATDLGAHEFSLGLTFRAVGTYKLKATDSANSAISGEITVNVTSAQVGQSTSSNAIKVTAPQSGTYNLSTHTISGQAQPGAALKIYSNDKEIGAIDADQNGAFSFKTPQLPEGKNSIRVVSVNDAGVSIASSELIELMVQTLGPDLKSFVLNPSGPVEAGSLVKATIESDGGLALVALVVEGNITVLSEDIASSGTYVGNFLAPESVGEYQIDVLMNDALGNETLLKEKAKLTVGQVGSLETPKEETSGLSIGNVLGLKAFAGDSRVTLEWLPVDGAKFYRVYYGLRADSLINAVDTFEGLNKWYVPNLSNGTQYFFAVSAVSETGAESSVKSAIVSSSPFKPDDAGLNAGFILPEVDVTELRPAAAMQANLAKPELGKTGPGALVLIGFSLMSAAFWRRKGII